MNRKSNLILINRVVYVLEIILSLLLVIGIIISIPDLVKYFVSILNSPKGISYSLYQEFLSHVLLLVIGLEFTLMMIAHADSSVIYLMVMVIARKMLIYGDTTIDLLIGVVAIFILFVIKKYFMAQPIDSTVSVGIFSASTDVTNINERFHYHIDSLGFQSLGGLVYYLLDQQGLTAEVGMLVDDKEYIYQIDSVKNGIIQEISVQKK
ncbi:hypothetical protein LQU94_07320 [Peptoniphilus sp. KCTC 25270]|uniref:hypothetical protein n=1 Tax=Peptoniphilus sp. KCTC 25270 TaxID=2897414 RepID=UPI001E5CEB2C|nr:hypothetical protein [Peptoniphilus sp. KCTC 25270]MCD1147920.1 hypothetical protein [Peptoniphilus sp. KCTC 25270]